MLNRGIVLSRRQRQSAVAVVGAVLVVVALFTTLSPTVRGLVRGDRPLEVQATPGPDEDATGTTRLADATTDVLGRFATYGRAEPAGSGSSAGTGTGRRPPTAGPEPLAPATAPTVAPGDGTTLAPSEATSATAPVSVTFFPPGEPVTGPTLTTTTARSATTEPPATTTRPTATIEPPATTTRPTATTEPPATTTRPPSITEPPTTTTRPPTTHGPSSTETPTTAESAARTP